MRVGSTRLAQRGQRGVLGERPDDEVVLGQVDRSAGATGGDELGPRLSAGSIGVAPHVQQRGGLTVGRHGVRRPALAAWRRRTVAVADARVEEAARSDNGCQPQVVGVRGDHLGHPLGVGDVGNEHPAPPVRPGNGDGTVGFGERARPLPPAARSARDGRLCGHGGARRGRAGVGRIGHGWAPGVRPVRAGRVAVGDDPVPPRTHACAGRRVRRRRSSAVHPDRGRRGARRSRHPARCAPGGGHRPLPARSAMRAADRRAVREVGAAGARRPARRGWSPALEGSRQPGTCRSGLRSPITGTATTARCGRASSRAGRSCRRCGQAAAAPSPASSAPRRGARHRAGRAAAAVVRASSSGPAPNVPRPKYSDVFPELGDELADVLARLRRLNDRFAPAAPVPVHGAASPDQWLDDGSTLGLVDFDRFAWSDPELDVAAFLGPLDFEAPLRGLARRPRGRAPRRTPPGRLRPGCPPMRRVPGGRRTAQGRPHRNGRASRRRRTRRVPPSGRRGEVAERPSDSIDRTEVEIDGTLPDLSAVGGPFFDRLAEVEPDEDARMRILGRSLGEGGIRAEHR